MNAWRPSLWITPRECRDAGEPIRRENIRRLARLAERGEPLFEPSPPHPGLRLRQVVAGLAG